MRIGITLSMNAYTPEAYAYEEYLRKMGHQVELDYNLNPNNDINIYFMGLRPFWKRKTGRAKEVHEYQSLSTPSFAHLKNFAKKNMNKTPDGRIFLNSFVHRKFGFDDDVPFIYRDMGVEEAFFQKPNENPEYDIIYCGSVSTRVGLIETLLSLAKYFKVLVVGSISKSDQELLKSINITLIGAVSRDAIPALYRNARFGLNYTPDIYPYNVQTSTKTLEYLAAGLGVISNRYKWAVNFFDKIDYQPIWLDENIIKVLENEISICESIHDFSWPKILHDSNFEGFLNELLYEK